MSAIRIIKKSAPACRSLILFLASIVSALVLAEIIVRYTTPLQRGVSWYHYDTRYEFRHRSNMDVVTTEWGDGKPWRLRTNSRGFRGDEWRPDMTNGLNRLAIIGDSFTLGDGVEEGDTFVGVVGQQLGAFWEVINLGVSAWGPENALAYLETEGADLRGHCLIYAFFTGNDYQDYKRSRLFLHQDGLLMRAPSTDDKPQPVLRRLARAVSVYDFLIQHSQVFNIIRHLVIQEMARGKRVVAGNIVTTNANDTAEVKSQPSLSQASIQHTNAVMTILKEVASANFDGFGMVIIPSKEQFDTSSDTSTTGSKATQIATHSQSAILDWCDHNSLKCLNLLKEMPRNPEQVSRLYFKKDFHMSEEGNFVVGSLIAANIETLCGTN